MIFQGFKKFQSWKISRQQQLMEMAVGNFLNIFAVSAIIILLTLLTLGISYHLRFKLKNCVAGLNNCRKGKGNSRIIKI